MLYCIVLLIVQFNFVNGINKCPRIRLILSNTAVKHSIKAGMHKIHQHLGRSPQTLLYFNFTNGNSSLKILATSPYTVVTAICVIILLFLLSSLKDKASSKHQSHFVCLFIDNRAME